MKGMTGSYIGVRWKHGCEPHVEDYHGFKVNSCFTSDLECLLVKLHSNEKVVEINPEPFSPSIKFPGCSSKNLVKGYQVFQ
ncbi:MAG: hypothetical protein ACKPKO_30470, partial [Candidatus Fonsibacter sp.]